jgi:hypothetical protein
MIRKIDGLKPKPVIVVLCFQVINLSLRFGSAANFLKIYPEQRVGTSPLAHVESQTPSTVFDFALVAHNDSPRGSPAQAIDSLLAQPWRCDCQPESFSRRTTWQAVLQLPSICYPTTNPSKTEVLTTPLLFPATLSVKYAASGNSSGSDDVEMPRNILGIILGVPKSNRFLLVHGSRNQMSTFITTARSLLLFVANLYSLPIAFFKVHNKNRFLMGTRDCFSRSCIISCSISARGWEASPKGLATEAFARAGRCLIRRARISSLPGG